MTKRFISLAITLAFLALACVSLNAQSSFGEIHGTVQDSTGAVVPNASITLKDVNSGTARRAVTNSDGYYSYSSVPVGKYTILVEAQGFKKSQIEGIEVAGSSSQAFLSKLTVGAEGTSVEVIGIADTIIPTDSGEKSTVLQERQLQDFTVVGRNASEFIKILPGFSPRNNSDPVQSATDFSGEVTGINGNGDGGSQSPLNGGFVANGAGTTNKTGANGFVQNIDITADGAHVSDPGCNCATPVNPNTDMIQEFQVLTSNYGADNAKGPIIINTIGKSGGHDFHGEGYFYGRHNALNANRWLNNNLNIAKPQNKFFFPGGNIGGPVLIPHTDFNHNRDKLFFFTAFEYYYQTLDTGLLGATVPTSAMLGGDFSPTALAALGPRTAGGGTPSLLNDCLTGASNSGIVPAGCHDAGGNPNSYWGNTITTTPGTPAPFVGGVIPNGFLDQSGLNFLGKTYPAPNANPLSQANCISGGACDNYLNEVVFNQNMYQWYSKVDYNISDSTKLYVRYNLQRERQLFPVGLWWRNAQQVPYPTSVVAPNRSDSISASLTHVFNPTLSNEFVFGYTYIDFPNVFSDKTKVSRSALGIPFTGLFNNGVDQIPSATGWGGEFATLLNPAGFEAGGSQGLFAKKHLPTISDTLSKVWGTHTVKFGAFYEFVINNQPNNTNANGLFIEAGWAGGSSGNPYADLLGGFAGQYQETNYSNIHNEGYNTMEGFVTDHWKVTRRLTVDYGLRFSHLGNWYDRLGNGFAIWDPSLYNGAVGSGFDFHKQNSKVPSSGLPTRALFYQPRFGLAYDVFGTGKTILRGGWGQFRFHNAQFTQGLDQPVNVETPTLNSMTFAQIQTAASGVTLPFGTGAVSPTDDQSPLTTSYSFTISQRLPFASLLETSYVGNQSKYFLNGNGVGTNANVIPAGWLFTHLAPGTNPNVGANEYLTGNFPIYQTINVAQHNLYSNYNALQVSWVRQKGAYDLSLNYTFSKSLGIVGLDQLNLNNDYGASQFDRRHLFNAAYSINLPSPIKGSKFGEGVVNGWQVSGITSVQSGVNLSGTSNGGNADFNTGGNITGVTTTTGFNVSAQSINGTDQIPLMPIVTCDPRKGLGPHQYINGSCFQLPTAPGANGNAVLPEIFGPWFWTSDLALFKNFQMGESRKLQFRFSAFNFMNHSLWTMAGSGYGQGNMNLVFNGSTSNTNTAFGVAPYKVGNRIVEMAVKFYF